MPPTHSLDRFLQRWEDSVNKGSFVRATLSGPVSKAEGAVERLRIRLITLRGESMFSVDHLGPRQNHTQNHAPAAFFIFLRDQLTRAYRNALLCTVQKDWQYSCSETGDDKLIEHPPSQTTVPGRRHDSQKISVLDARANDWLTALGVLGSDGRVKASMADKHRQIHRYLEILSHHLASTGTGDGLSLVDMGCGKGYLTFAIWHWLNRVQSLGIQVIGIESRADLVAHGNQVAARIGAQHLSFCTGSIAESPLPPKLHAVVALHACNTATDDPLRRGVEAKATHILLSPCCHQDLRHRIESPPPWDALFSHGLLKERFAEWFTDSLRALYLQASGYQVRAMEFIASEHTPKNLLLCAQRGGTPSDREQARERIKALERQFGILDHPLQGLLDRVD